MPLFLWALLSGKSEKFFRRENTYNAVASVSTQSRFVTISYKFLPICSPALTSGMNSSSNERHFSRFPLGVSGGAHRKIHQRDNNSVTSIKRAFIGIVFL